MQNLIRSYAVFILIFTCVLFENFAFAEEKNNYKASTTTIRTNVQERTNEQKYCSDFLSPIELTEYNSEKAEVDNDYCKAERELRKAISKLSNPPRECREDGSWMSIILNKIQRHKSDHNRLKYLCEEQEKSISKNIQIKKQNEGITLIQK